VSPFESRYVDAIDRPTGPRGSACALGRLEALDVTPPRLRARSTPLSVSRLPAARPAAIAVRMSRFLGRFVLVRRLEMPLRPAERELPPLAAINPRPRKMGFFSYRKTARVRSRERNRGHRNHTFRVRAAVS